MKLLTIVAVVLGILAGNAFGQSNLQGSSDQSQSVAHSASKAGIASHRSLLTRKNRKPQNPRRLIQVFTSTDSPSCRGYEDLVR